MLRTLKLVSGLPTKELVETIQFHRREGETAGRSLAFYLYDMHKRREYQALGYSSTIHFGELALDMAPRETRELLRIARELEDLPELDRAFADGTMRTVAVSF